MLASSFLSTNFSKSWESFCVLLFPWQWAIPLTYAIPYEARTHTCRISPWQEQQTAPGYRQPRCSPHHAGLLDFMLKEYHWQHPRRQALFSRGADYPYIGRTTLS